MNVAIITTAIPALRPLWARIIIQNRKNSKPVRRPNDKQRVNSTYVMMDKQKEAALLPSCIEARIAAQGGRDRGTWEVNPCSCPTAMES